MDVKHNYACLPLFRSDEIDIMIEYLCTVQRLCSSRMALYKFDYYYYYY